MAEIVRKQKLINLHTSAMTTAKESDLISALDFGEIAIEHSPGVAIYTKATSGNTCYLAKFIDKAAVKALINAEGVEAVKARVQALEGLHASGSTSGTFLTVATEITNAIAGLDAEKSQTAGADGLALSITEVDGKITSISGSIVENTYDAYGAADDAYASGKTYTDTQVSAEETRAKGIENGILALHAAGETTGTKATVAQEVAAGINALDKTVSQAAAAANGQLRLEVVQENGLLKSVSGSISANTYDVYGAAASAKTEILGSASTEYNDLGKVEAMILAEATRAGTAEEANASGITTINGQLSGFSTEQGSVKAYVDNKVTALLKFKGSVLAFTELPDITTTAVTHGDVYNIQNAFEYEGKKYPAGTNVVAVKEGNDAANWYWDALGGTVDLEPYAKKEDGGDTAASMSVKGAKLYADGLNTSMDARVKKFEANGDLDVAAIKTVVDRLDGADTVDGSVKKQIKAAKDAIDAYTINGHAISVSPVLDGADIKLDGYAKAAAAAAIAATDTVNDAFGKLEIKVDADIAELSSYKSSHNARHAAGKTVAEEVAAGIADLDVTNNVSDTVNGVAITVNETDGKVLKPVVGITAGTIANGDTNVVLGGAVYTADEAVKTTLIGASTDASGATTIHGAKNYAKAYADGLNTAMDTRVDALEAKHASGKTVAQEVTDGIAAIASVTKTATASCGATASVTTAAGSVSAVSIDMTELIIDCGEF